MMFFVYLLYVVFPRCSSNKYFVQSMLKSYIKKLYVGGVVMRGVTSTELPFSPGCQRAFIPVFQPGLSIRDKCALSICPGSSRPGTNAIFPTKKRIPQARPRPHAGSLLSKSLDDKIIHETNHNRNPQTNHSYNLSQIIHIISILESLKKKERKQRGLL